MRRIAFLMYYLRKRTMDRNVPLMTWTRSIEEAYLEFFSLSRVFCSLDSANQFSACIHFCLVVCSVDGPIYFSITRFSPFLTILQGLLSIQVLWIPWILLLMVRRLVVHGVPGWRSSQACQRPKRAWMKQLPDPYINNDLIQVLETYYAQTLPPKLVCPALWMKVNSHGDK